jgi:hypothetical protein
MGYNKKLNNISVYHPTKKQKVPLALFAFYAKTNRR